MSHFSFPTTQPNPNHSQVKDVSPEDVLAHKDQLCLIDVRRPDEYVGELGHIPGASLITLDTLPQHWNQIPDNKTVVFVCRSGGRSGQATAMAQEVGRTAVYNMQGGMIQWNQLGYTTEKDNV